MQKCGPWIIYQEKELDSMLKFAFLAPHQFRLKKYPHSVLIGLTLGKGILISPGSFCIGFCQLIFIKTLFFKVKIDCNLVSLTQSSLLSLIKNAR